MNNPEDTACRIWPGFQAKVTQCHPLERSTYVIDSLRAGGSYRIIDRAEGILNRVEDPFGSEVRARITTMLIDQRGPNEEFPTVNVELIKKAEESSPLSPGTRADRLLRYMRSTIDGDLLPVPLFAPDVWPAALAHSESTSGDELRLLLKHLESQSLVELPSSETEGYKPIITVKGIKHIDTSSATPGRGPIGFNTA